MILRLNALSVSCQGFPGYSVCSSFSFATGNPLQPLHHARQLASGSCVTRVLHPGQRVELSSEKISTARPQAGH